MPKAHDKVKLDKEIIFVGAILGVFLLVFLIMGPELLVDLVGFVYPMYASLKAIETFSKDDDKQWLTYWVVFSLFKVYLLLSFSFIIVCNMLLSTGGGRTSRFYYLIHPILLFHQSIKLHIYFFINIIFIIINIMCSYVLIYVFLYLCYFCCL